MKGDFSRDTFDRRHHFSRVLMQQGRVLLDADWNEQTSILLHYIRALAADLIGRHGGPGDGFKIDCTSKDGTALHCDFIIGHGHYYVDGILVENLPAASCPPDETPTPTTYGNQPHLPEPVELKPGARYLVYLDVWERHLTHLEIEHIREVALGGPDTASRAGIVWQVKVVDESQCGHEHPEEASCAALLEAWVRRRAACLSARARVSKQSEDPCIIPPEARFRGAENQLYRVEIHDGGETAKGAAAKYGATFKWSRDNGSVVFGVRTLEGGVATLDALGPDDRRGLKEGDWVEVVDDGSVLRGEAGRMARVEAVDPVGFRVTLDAGNGSLPAYDEGSTTHRLLRRWDQGSATIAVQEGRWIELEDGVQISFEPDGAYRTGDYWLIPARTATRDVLWPAEAAGPGATKPKAMPPHGIEHHYAPLARIELDDKGHCELVKDCRCVFLHLCTLAEYHAEPAPEERRQPEREVERPSRVEAIAGLRRITDVGVARATAFFEAGRETPAAVAAMSVEEIRGLLDVREELARNIRDSARTLSEGGR